MPPFQSEDPTDSFPPDPYIELGVGVFYFPPTSLSASDQMTVIDRTLSRLTMILESVENAELKGRDARKIDDILTWLTRFKNLLTREKEKLADVIAKGDEQISLPIDETEGPSTTMNGHS